MTEQTSKYSDYSNMDTSDGMKKYPSSDLDCKQSVFAFNEYPVKNEIKHIANKEKEAKKNILEEISSLDGSIDNHSEVYSSASNDKKNYHTIKNMLGDMKEMISSCSYNQSTHIPEDYENSNFSIFMPNKVYNDMNEDNFSMKCFKSIYDTEEQNDMMEKELDNCYDNIDFF